MILKREADLNKKEKERKERNREISRWKEQLCWYLIRIHSMLPDNKLQFNTERERELYLGLSEHYCFFALPVRHKQEACNWAEPGRNTKK